MKQRVFKKFDIRNVLKLPEINLARNAASRTNQMIKDANSTVATPPKTCARWIDQNCRSRAKATAVLTERFPVSSQAIDWVLEPNNAANKITAAAAIAYQIRVQSRSQNQEP